MLIANYNIVLLKMKEKIGEKNTIYIIFFFYLKNVFLFILSHDFLIPRVTSMT